jgi:hypothetical protein
MAMQQHSDNQGMPYRESLSIDIDAELMRRIRFAAARSRLSIRDYVEDTLEEVVPTDISESQERSPVTCEALDGLLELREQFKKNHPGQVLDDSTEIIRQMREERSQYLADL